MAIEFDGKGNIVSTTEDGVIAVKLYSLEKQIEEKDKEIDRLNKECDTYMKIATKRGNIINELEKWLNKVLEIYINVDIKTLLMVKDKLKELKEGNK